MVTHSLSQLAAAATRTLGQAGGSQPWLRDQLLSGCGALCSCLILACHVPLLSAQTSFKLGAAASLVFGPASEFLHLAATATAAEGSYCRPESLATFVAIHTSTVNLLV